MKIEIKKAKQSEAEILTEISKRAFNNDITVGAEGTGGPPGYDSVNWQKMIMKKSEYYSVSCDGIIIGGAIIFRKGYGHIYIGRIFVEPAYHRQGIGIKIMKFIEQSHPDIKLITLETPAWNVRTRQFYQKVGYKIIKETKEDIFFEKRVAE